MWLHVLVLFALQMAGRFAFTTSTIGRTSRVVPARFARSVDITNVPRLAEAPLRA